MGRFAAYSGHEARGCESDHTKSDQDCGIRGHLALFLTDIGSAGYFLLNQSASSDICLEADLEVIPGKPRPVPTR
jgi:hypothetical protein